MDIEALKEFAAPYYQNKDIMHNLSHIEKVLSSVNWLVSTLGESIDMEVIVHAAYFHGLIYTNEDEIVKWLKSRDMPEEKVKFITKVAWESQKGEVPDTLEGKILHDAHIIEGGKTYLIVKSLITGSVRGQTLEQTITYIENNVLGKGCCYLSEAQKVYAGQQRFAVEFIRDLKEGI